MTSKPISTYGWFPAANGGMTQAQWEQHITADWFHQNLANDQAQCLWQTALQGRKPNTAPETLTRICKYDSAELIDLLYPRFPQLFRTARRYTLSPQLLSCVWEDVPYSEELLMQCCSARTAYLDATCLFTLCGAVNCLETLLEHGADPNGMDTPNSWSYMELPNSLIMPVTPMDCALLSDNEDCQLMLELYGGRILHEHLAAL